MNQDQSNKLFSSHWTYIVLIGVAFAVWAFYFILNSSYLDPVTGQRYFVLFDDAMISMRYAYNLAHGNGLVWTPGEHVEGITNLLMTLHMSVMTLIFDKSNAVFAVQLSGIVFVLTTAFFCLKIGELLLKERELPKQTFIRALFFLSPIIYYHLSFWALMGMENGLLSALLTSAIYVAMKRDGSDKTSILLPILLGLAFLTRPDAAIPIALIMLYRTLGLMTKQGIKTVFLEGIVLSIFVFGLTAFRYFYYGEIYPNTYLLKVVGMPFGTRISNGLIYVTPFLQLVALPIFIAVMSLIFSFNRKVALIVAMLFATICYQVYVGGDAFVLWRMFVVVMPLVTVMCFVEIYALCREKLNSNIFAQHCTISFMLLSFIFLYNWDSKDYIALNQSAEFWSAGHFNIKTALALKEVTTPDAMVGLVYAGIIPYYTELPSHDFLGKSDKHIASLNPDLSGAVAAHGMSTHPGHNKYDLNYSIKQIQPDYVQTFKWGSQDLSRFARKRYEIVNYKGVRLFLKRGSKNILWDKLR